jgi:disulfide bond formation protein DsbB
MERHESAARAWTLLFLSWLIALGASLGAIFIGEVMGQTPCLLCWWQRVFMFPLAIMLGVGVLKPDDGAFRYGLPLSLLGAGVAAYHSLLYADILSEAMRPCTQTGPSCTDAAMTVMGLPLPYLSLSAFVAITGLLFLSRRDNA